MNLDRIRPAPDPVRTAHVEIPSLVEVRVADDDAVTEAHGLLDVVQRSSVPFLKRVGLQPLRVVGNVQRARVGVDRLEELASSPLLLVKC